MGTFPDVNPSAQTGKPSRQLGYFGVQPSSRLALSLLAPRPSIIHETIISPPSSRPSQAGARMGGFASRQAAR